VWSSILGLPRTQPEFAPFFEHLLHLFEAFRGAKSPDLSLYQSGQMRMTTTAALEAIMSALQSIVAAPSDETAQAVELVERFLVASMIPSVFSPATRSRRRSRKA